ncbi:avidin-related protein 4/5-like isoform X2 [Pelobates fuscus]|uniref:avidin-related protein 4/5-like isoform X2 n=1 Tax=Pelobates fuscus TaxID=191477 RepID=UPI002FE4F722
MAALLLQAVVLCLYVLGACGTDLHKERCNVSGVWVNSLGSMLTLSVDEGSHLRGFLKSSVESSPLAAGENMIGKVSGVLGSGMEPTLAMSVTWSGGSVSTWAGQCFQGLKTPVIRTMWLLRSQVDTEDKNWMATRIGEDTFHPKRRELNLS